MADKKYPDYGTPAYKKALAQGYREGGLTKTQDRSSPSYSRLNRDVTKRGIDPYSNEAYRPNRAIARRTGESERFDDQIKRSNEDSDRVAKRSSDSAIDSMSKKPYTGFKQSDVLGSFKRGGKVKRTGVYKLHKGETVARSKGGRMRSR